MKVVGEQKTCGTSCETHFHLRKLSRKWVHIRLISRTFVLENLRRENTETKQICSLTFGSMLHNFFHCLIFNLSLGFCTYLGVFKLFKE